MERFITFVRQSCRITGGSDQPEEASEAYIHEQTKELIKKMDQN
ncbi:MAG: hypothetical protein ACLSG9_10595 [Eubacterium sp.]